MPIYAHEGVLGMGVLPATADVAWDESARFVQRCRHAARPRCRSRIEAAERRRRVYAGRTRAQGSACGSALVGTHRR